MRSAGLALAASACVVPSDHDVVAQFEAQCVACHHRDGPAAPSLEDAASVRLMADVLHHAVAERAMPPWLPGPRSAPLRGSLALSKQDRRALLRWLDAGLPGAPDHFVVPAREALAAPSSVPLPPIESTGEAWTCAQATVPPGLLTGFDVVGASPVVHHVLLGIWPASARATLEARDAADPGPGWACPDAFMGGTPAPDRVPVLWFPTPQPARMWPGTGAPLDGVAVVQVHTLGTGSVQGAMQLEVQDSAVSEISIALGTGHVPLPPDEAVVTVERKGRVGDWLREPVPGDGVWIVGVRGHGHEQLDTLQITLDGEPLLDIPRWDPHFQARYLLDSPVFASLEARLDLQCTYDNSPERRAHAATYGDEGEMCGGWAFVVPELPRSP